MVRGMVGSRVMYCVDESPHKDRMWVHVCERGQMKVRELGEKCPFFDVTKGGVQKGNKSRRALERI